MKERGGEGENERKKPRRRGMHLFFRSLFWRRFQGLDASALAGRECDAGQGKSRSRPSFHLNGAHTRAQFGKREADEK